MRFSVATLALAASPALALAPRAPTKVSSSSTSTNSATGLAPAVAPNGPTFSPVPMDTAHGKVQNANANKPLKPNTNVNAATQPKCANLRVRNEWRLLSDSQRSSFVNAIKCLTQKPSGGNFPGSHSRFEDLVVVHQKMVNSIHMVAQFLPWHRYMLHIFEGLLQSECGYPGPIPWWDETQDAGHFSTSLMFNGNWFGHGPLANGNGAGTCITSGVFAGLTCHVGPGSSDTTRCLARSVDESLTAQCNANYVRTCRNANDYSDFEECTEYGPHAYGHNGIGAVMSDVASSPSDPVFYMHHTFVDHSWRIWQNDQYPARVTSIDGPTQQGGGGPELTLDYVLSSMGLAPSVTVRDVMDTTAQYLCYKYNV